MLRSVDWGDQFCTMRLYCRSLQNFQVWGILFAAGNRHIVVTGSPGVGKSVWILYLLATAPFKTIITQQGDGFYIFTAYVQLAIYSKQARDNRLAESAYDETIYRNL